MTDSGYSRAIYLMHLANVPMFSACSTSELERVADLARPRQVKAGEELVRQGDPGHEFFVLSAGTAIATRDGEEVAKLGEGSYFGELALLDPAPRNATVTAATPATVVTLTRDAFVELLGEIPSIRDALLLGMARRLHEMDSPGARSSS
jgi:CRP-like cAMP-binding protein